MLRGADESGELNPSGGGGTGAGQPGDDERSESELLNE
jgi:hypothetical protein